MDVTIAKARPDDGPELLQLLRTSGLPLDGALDHLPTALVARAEARIVGSAVLELCGEGALLRSVAVDTAARGTGLGRQLTEAAVRLAADHGVSAVYLLTTTAEHYFPRCGFSPIPRDQVPASVQQSIEFRSVCPASAIVMRRLLAGARV